MDSFEVRAANGTIIVTQEKVTIRRKGAVSFLTQGLKGDKEILIEDISTIQVRKPKLGSRGYIQFGFKGGTENKGGLMNAVSDENTVLFDKKHADDVIKAKELVEEYRRVARRGEGTVARVSEADELEKLSSLRDRKILTEEEFTAKKLQVLGL